MRVTEITGITENQKCYNRTVSADDMQREYDYYMAQEMLTVLFLAGFISLSEFDKITELNRKTFSPYLAEIMP